MSVKGSKMEITYKYNPDMIAKFSDLLLSGSGRVEATHICDISYETFTRWMEQKPEFKEAVQKAESECKVRNIKIVQKAALSTWQAAAWWLERKHRDEFALQRQEIVHSGKIDTDIKIDVKILDNSKLLDVIKQQTVNK